MASLNDEVFRKIADLKELRNCAEPRLHQLPPEVFRYILSHTLDYSSWQVKQTHDLAKISRHWRDTVLSSSRFWPEVDVAQGTRVTALVLKRSGAGQIVVRCSANVDELERRLEFMRVAVQHRERWSTLLFKGPATDELWDLLQTDAPRLSELFLYVYKTDDSTQRVFSLGDGSLLRHVDLDYCTVPWDSMRLSRLESIQIRNVTGEFATLARFHEILAASPRLTWLALVMIQGPPEPEPIAVEGSQPQPAPERRVHDPAPDTIIPLKSLNTLLLRDIPPHFMDHIISHIDAPAMTCMMVGPINASHFHPEAQFMSNIRPLLRAEGHIHLKFSEKMKDCRLTSVRDKEPSATNEWIHWAKTDPGYDIIVKLDDPVTFWADLEATQRELVSKPSGCVYLNQPAEDATESAQWSFPVTLMDSFPGVYNIQCRTPSAVPSLLQHLQQPRKAKGADEVAWPLSNLKFLALQPWLSDEDSMVEAIVAFARARYPPEPVAVEPTPAPPAPVEPPVEPPVAVPIEAPVEAPAETPATVDAPAPTEATAEATVVEEPVAMEEAATELPQPESEISVSAGEIEAAEESSASVDLPMEESAVETVAMDTAGNDEEAAVVEELVAPTDQPAMEIEPPVTAAPPAPPVGGPVEPLVELTEHTDAPPAIPKPVKLVKLTVAEALVERLRTETAMQGIEIAALPADT